ncbi:hypothetical protein [Mesorhizobium sp.]|uniref:hypothetical protein n=2 Tax=Mesorhizobium sp. TaxID=1871066 RepID=UPI000FE6D53D|nr:hypothetical protein [Mesorhizobium sp.]RWK44844.1 MAG: hypothetical protein EOR47_33730 [Mesorhizobium sp.]TIP39009.1 MAG: hypothetical protein E5X62_32375 [Mesorhizobium sp.]TIQ13001.1 MAG: hypothetical protein E5X57_10285 [Mesorhizobium sp.]
MTYQSEVASGTAARSAYRLDTREEYICWSRMQAEAGQLLEAIVARKETERRAGGGIFLWGVGNPPAAIASVLARTNAPVRAVFSIMKSRPKMVDVAPARTVVWRRYIDAQGVNRPLPPHALVTSRGHSAGGTKLRHYALMCRSEEPLLVRRGEPFDPAAFRNAGGTGAPVGASQVTALLRRVAADSDDADYEVNLNAWLAESYWVRLIDPAELDLGKLAMLHTLADLEPENWCKAVAEIRGGLPEIQETKARGTLL